MAGAAHGKSQSTLDPMFVAVDLAIRRPPLSGAGCSMRLTANAFNAPKKKHALTPGCNKKGWPREVASPVTQHKSTNASGVARHRDNSMKCALTFNAFCAPVRIKLGTTMVLQVLYNFR